MARNRTASRERAERRAERAPLGASAPPAIVADPSNEPCPPGHARFVCISDTHGQHGKIARVPDGDVLIHAGDFSSTGEFEQVQSLERWLSCLPHAHKIVIAGNHDLTFQRDFYEANWRRFHHEKLDCGPIRALLADSPNLTYLEDSETMVFGLRIYGSPWQPEFCNWAFNLPRGAPCAERWRRIPEGIDVLVTHGPPAGHGSRCWGSGFDAGCEDLLHRVRRLRPRAHVFGHIHEGYGATSDGVTTFINASTCTLKYTPTNAPIVFDVRLPDADGAAPAGSPRTAAEGSARPAAGDGTISALADAAGRTSIAS